MLFIQIDGVPYRMKAQTFRTQRGQEGIRIFSKEAPLAEDGFKIVDGNNKVISDKSEFKYLYRENENCREYVTRPEEPIPTKSSYTGGQPESPYSILSRQISAVSAQVSEITPYEETKDAYIGDTECVFNVSINGDISAFVVDRDGNTIPNKVIRESDKIKVLFDELEQVATVTISIQ